MKFKVIVTTLLAAILGVCIFTSYALINEAQKQTEIATINTKINLEMAYQTDSDIVWGTISNLHRDLMNIVGNKAIIEGPNRLNP